MKISIIGAGYVGLVSGACLADFGHQVTCVDKDEEKVLKLKQGKIPIFEPGLDVLVRKNLDTGLISFSLNLKSAIEKSEAIFVAVGTPSSKDTGAADLTYLFNACDQIKKHANENKFVVIKSTVPVGTNKIVSDYLNTGKKKFDVISNPEFLREGSAVDDFMRPDRIIIGVRKKRAFAIMKSIYKPLYLRDFPLISTDPESAEIIKYASNAFLATKISFINEMAHLCEKVGGDIKEVSKGMGLDKRIGDKFLHAGPGYGGSCFPKDTSAILKIAKENELPLDIIEAVINVNQRVKSRMIDKIKHILSNRIEGKTVVFLGVTFKPNTDDMREAPSLIIIPELIKQGALVRVVDPQGKSEAKRLLGNIEWFEDLYLASENADLLVILTEWNIFRALELKRIAELMKTPKLADLRNVYSSEEVLANGFLEYVSVGRS